MKRFKRVFAIVMTLAMLMSLGIGLTTSAAGEDASITIKAPGSGSLSLEGQVFNAYKIFDLEISTDSVTGEIDGYIYKPITVYEDWYDDVLDYAGIISGSTEDLLSWMGEATPVELDDIGILLAAFIKGPPPIDSDGTATGTTGPSVTISGLDYGYYFITGNGKAEGDKEITSLHTFVTVPGTDSLGAPEDNIAIKIKADAPSIEKQVWNHGTKGPNELHGPAEPLSLGSEQWTDWTDVNIGDPVYFHHVSKVPLMLGYDKYWFIVHDSMSAGLTLIHDSDNILTSSFVVMVGTTILDIVEDEDRFTAGPGGAAEYYVVVDSDYAGTGAYSDTETTNFMVVINPYWFVTQSPAEAGAGKDIIIEYMAYLNENAVIGYEPSSDWGNPNKVYLEYSSNPYDTGDGSYDDKGDTKDTPEDEVWVYTFDIDLYKYTGTFGETSEKPLPGAKFELRRLPEPVAPKTSVVQFVSVGEDTSGTAVYRVAYPWEKIDPGKTSSEILTTPVSGKIRLIGLDAGMYKLIETEAPAGYNPLDSYVQVLIIHGEDEHDVQEYSVAWINKDVDDNTIGSVASGSVNIQNNTGTIFPDTGGIGRTIFIVVGLTIMAGAVVALSVRRKVSRAVR